VPENTVALDVHPGILVLRSYSFYELCRSLSVYIIQSFGAFVNQNYLLTKGIFGCIVKAIVNSKERTMRRTAAERRAEAERARQITEQLVQPATAKEAFAKLMNEAAVFQSLERLTKR